MGLFRRPGCDRLLRGAFARLVSVLSCSVLPGEALTVALCERTDRDQGVLSS